MSSLYPGYKHVSSFGDPSEYASDEEEEVSYVTLDLGSIEPSLVPSSSTYRLIGLDTPTPFLQLSGTILKGRHETLLGSEILFTDPPDKRSLTPLTPPTTSTRICFSEARLLPKGTVASSSSSVLPVPPSTTTPSALDITSFPLDPALNPSLARPGPSTSSTSKRRSRKDKDNDAQESWPAAADAASLLLDRVTGKNTPRARVPRTSTRKAKGKGKATAVSEDEVDNDAMDVDGELDEGRGSDDFLGTPSSEVEFARVRYTPRPTTPSRNDRTVSLATSVSNRASRYVPTRRSNATDCIFATSNYGTPADNRTPLHPRLRPSSTTSHKQSGLGPRLGLSLEMDRL
ncbi:hypothetical protein DXG01_016174 [Tephrocybe rancida]|nr:hypothetical protein DXG01_016174 [Tephrocybe rancida]